MHPRGQMHDGFDPGKRFRPVGIRTNVRDGMPGNAFGKGCCGVAYDRMDLPALIDQVSAEPPPDETAGSGDQDAFQLRGIPDSAQQFKAITGFDIVDHQAMSLEKGNGPGQIQHCVA